MPRDRRTLWSSTFGNSIRPPERCTVGALREEAGDHDISIVAHGVREDRATTIGDFANRWTK